VPARLRHLRRGRDGSPLQGRRRRPGRRRTHRPQGLGRSVDARVRLHPGGGSGGLRQGVAVVRRSPGEGHRQAGAVLPGAEQRGAARGDARRPVARGRLQHRLEPARGQLRGLRAVRDDGLEGRPLRLRDGDHHLPGQRHRQGGGHPRQAAGVHLRDFELGLQGALGAAARPVQDGARQRLHAGVQRQARQLHPGGGEQGLPGRGHRQFGEGAHGGPGRGQAGPDPRDLQVADLPHHRLRVRPQPSARARREGARGVLLVQLGRHRAGGRVQQGRAAAGEVHAHHLQAALAGGARHRPRHERQLRLQVARRRCSSCAS